jgi:hypothetical protein
MRRFVVLAQECVLSFRDDTYISLVLLTWLCATAVFMPLCITIDTLLGREPEFLEITQLYSMHVGNLWIPRQDLHDYFIGVFDEE